MCVVITLPGHGSKLARYERVKSKWEQTEPALRKHIAYHIRTQHVGSTIVLGLRMNNTKRHLCFVAVGPLCSPEVVDERSLRTGEGLSEDATESVVLLNDTASSAMALPHLKPLVPPSQRCPARGWPSLALVQLASWRASNTASPTMVGHCYWHHNGYQGAEPSCAYALDASRCRKGEVTHTPSSVSSSLLLSLN